MTDDAPVLVFDGVCVLCSRWVHFILRHERAPRIRFAAMQSATGRSLLVAHGLDADDPLSLLYVEDGVGHVDSDAILSIATGLGGFARCAGIARVIPRGVRDRLYRTLARHRYRWFGRNGSCLVPAAEHAGRFLP